MTETAGLRPHDHVVSFYDHDTDIVGDVARFVAAGLGGEDRVIVIATPEHRAAIEDILPQYAFDADQLRVSGRLVMLDAAETLARFMSDGVPDENRFERCMGGLIDAAASDGSPVRAFGEMVALLWGDGNIAGAVEVEALWNELAVGRQFLLMCAYPTSALHGTSLADASHVCELHSTVAPPRSYWATGTPRAPAGTGATRVSDVYVPVTAAVPATRRFVSSTLRSWGLDRLIADAEVVVSELATNAINHASSAFRVHMDRHPTAVRIAVEDIGPTLPIARNATVDDFHGRGVAIVDRLTARWGFDLLGEAKSVWAELEVS